MRIGYLGAARLGLILGSALLLGFGCGPGAWFFPSSGASLGVSGGDASATDADTGAGLTADCEAIGRPVDAIHEEMLRVLNAYRTNNRLPALAYSKRLEAAADAHARDMWQRGFFAHENPDGDGPPERALRAGFCHSYVGENIAEGDGLPTVAQVQAGWVASPGHNANMLNEPYRLVGMGHYYDPVTKYHYWVQDFALPNE